MRVLYGVSVSVLCKFSCTATSQYHRYNQLVQDTKFEEWQPTQHSMRNFTAVYVYYSCCTHALPGIVDGAIKILQGGSWIWAVASSPILEATTSRKQCILQVRGWVAQPAHSTVMWRCQRTPSTQALSSRAHESFGPTSNRRAVTEMS